MSVDIDSILSGTNTTYLLNLLKQYQSDPASIELTWAPILEKLSAEMANEVQPTWGEKLQKTDIYAEGRVVPVPNGEQATSYQDLKNTANALFLIRSFRVRGHIKAQLDPLNLKLLEDHPDLDPKTYGFKAEDFYKPIFVNGCFGHDFLPLHDLIEKLNKAYCGNMTLEYMHIQDLNEREWLQNRMENEPFSLTDHQKKDIFVQLTKAEFLEKFLHTKFPGAKRFGLDGAESFIPAMLYLIDKKATQGVKDIAIGMAHRGRLSTLAHVLQKSVRSIFGQFEGMSPLPNGINASSDVKYHLGFSNDVTLNAHDVHLSLLANPSHLEAVDPVVLGKVRAKQDLFGDDGFKKALGVIIHGDAAFAGQGIVPETLGMCALDGYETGGTIHIIINNQIGFTTMPQHSRSCPYSSDVAKFIQAPILHANGDDPESVIKAIDLACDYHEKFGHDVVIDIFCYRRFGHNEGDEPKFTQPIMYKTIESHETVRALFEKKLESTGVLTAQEAQVIGDNEMMFLKDEFDFVQNAKQKENTLEVKADWLEGQWKELKASVDDNDLLKPVKTGIDVQTLRAIGLKSLSIPERFNLNSKIERQWQQKREVLNTGEGVDWSLAERLAFASLLIEGHPVRLSGQDSQRGTFSQRHALVVDQETEEKFVGLNHIQKGQQKFTVLNSPLAEFSVLGFEYGYSLANPNALVLWEAQFGDFANGAQVIVDQFLSSAEMKWLRMSGLVVLLPHGFEGQGPEHTSARLERYLQLCAENNMIVANCSTPANYFHILRRQLKALYRKPLILMTPKSLLRHRECVSSLQDMGSKSIFQPVIADQLMPANVKKVIFCSGKIYYDLLSHRAQQNITDVALLRLEQFYPFPEKEIIACLKSYSDVPVIWCQEEPKNMGAWHFLDRRFEAVLTKWAGKLMRPIYIGRKEAASPAAGLLSQHVQEQSEIMESAFKTV
jgi:2-oxoglutarate dehydrogenase E1 component